MRNSSRRSRLFRDRAKRDDESRDGIVQSDLIGLPVIVQAGRLQVDTDGGRCRALGVRSYGGCCGFDCHDAMFLSLLRGVQRRLDERVSDDPVGRTALSAGVTKDRAAEVRSHVFRGPYGGDRALPHARSGFR